MEFWSLEHLDLEESLNIEIWYWSTIEQEQIQPYRSDWQLGEIGAQQAMRFPYRLPWVPDPLGYDWSKHDAVLVVGSAYGPFIGGDGRSHEIAPQEYACESCKEFGKIFFTQVIRRRPYYARVGEIVSAVVDSCRSMALFDLCRVAFVRRAPRRDEGGDKVTKCAPELFTMYVESATSNDWLWRRVLGSEASTILVLGTVAEHGILRLFTRNLRDMLISDSVDPTILFKCNSADYKWPAQYANARRKLKHRMEASSPPFWQVEGRTALGIQRTWHVAVVPHPTGARGSYGPYPIEALRAAYSPSL